ncbi:wobble nucleotide-excising tRNase [Bacillus oleivorans]|uniref:Nuclease SbcCD subunit C n=1 Tax=Bacillus oleivorans TaxID=1448271 RepID=A0A285CUC8_9BACI|nr:AAA family ATPase [Bacillus oleivorans]SNX71170.1 wobble nucleotide-excising tRNase [Bacillus oleivorans]
MIDKIRLREVATYDTSGIEVNLRKINYIFGSNGTGKTTVSEVLRKQEDFPSCRIEWGRERSNYDVFVYNRNFVRENFSMRNDIKGIFTLGKESTDLLKKIDKKSEEIDKHEDKIGNLEEKIKEIDEKINNLKADFMNTCWDLKLKYDEQFKEAFTGVRNKKDNFMLKCIEEAQNNDGVHYGFDELKKRVDSVFKGTQEKINTIPNIEYNASYEKSQIFGTRIVGKRDIDIADLISRLNISDWVQQGHQHLKNTDGLCPFCQQELPKNLEGKLEEYFDETYTEQLQLLNSSSEKYITETQGIIKNHHILTEGNIPFVNTEKVKSLLEIIISTFKENELKLERKKAEPSSSVKLSSISSYIREINEEIGQANIQIIKHNQMIDNITEEKAKLNKDIWRFIIEENKRDYASYTDKTTKECKTLDGMNKRWGELSGFRNELKKEVIQLQNQLTSVLPSINEINNLLKSFGFTNFELAESKEKGNYKIVRGDGVDANATLSEGEMTFITFLYFYQLINGSNEQDKVNTKRVIVIDDPISSLDSNVLFIVSYLINSLKKKIRSSDSIFKQLIILTHNVYFHKEISFNKGMSNKKQQDETFWVLTKTDNVSRIKEYDENPIKNSYELLWRELKENINSITTPNIMRRILENYFKFFGNIDVSEIVGKFPDEDKVVCNSLLSWANNGSHHVNDDLYVDSNQESNKAYFDVFRKIFVNSDHESHFKMMMEDFEYEIEEDSSEELARKEIQEALEQAAVGHE